MRQNEPRQHITLDCFLYGIGHSVNMITHYSAVLVNEYHQQCVHTFVFFTTLRPTVGQLRHRN